jgi:hypothetical protein
LADDGRKDPGKTLYVVLYDVEYDRSSGGRVRFFHHLLVCFKKRTTPLKNVIIIPSCAITMDRQMEARHFLLCYTQQQKLKIVPAIARHNNIIYNLAGQSI